jgi:hypothetical protein
VPNLRSLAWSAPLGLLLNTAVLAQEIPRTGPTPASFIPAGWSLLAQDSSDFDVDGLPDIVLILDSLDRDRPLLILLGTPGGYRLGARADSIVPEAASGGTLSDGFDRLVARQTSFLLSQYGGSTIRTGWSTQYRLEQGRWYSVGATRTTSVAAGTLECPSAGPKVDEICLAHKVDRNLVTGEIEESWDLENIGTDDLRTVRRRRRETPVARRPDPSFRYF